MPPLLGFVGALLLAASGYVKGDRWYWYALWLVLVGLYVIDIVIVIMERRA